MPERPSEFEVKVQKLAQRVRQGWAVLHPATAKERAAVRQAVTQQWQQEQAAKKSQQAGKSKQQRAQSKRIKSQHKGQEQRRQQSKRKAQQQQQQQQFPRHSH